MSCLFSWLIRVSETFTSSELVELYPDWLILYNGLRSINTTMPASAELNIRNVYWKAGHVLSYIYVTI